MVVKSGAAHVKRAEEMKDHFVRIVPDEVSGRRFPIGDRSGWNGPLTMRPVRPLTDHGSSACVVDAETVIVEGIAHARPVVVIHGRRERTVR